MLMLFGGLAGILNNEGLSSKFQDLVARCCKDCDKLIMLSASCAESCWFPAFSGTSHAD